VTIVFTLGGLGSRNTVETALHSWCSSEGRQHVVVDYPREGNADSILAGIANLDTALEEWLSRDAVVVMGHSQGAEVVSEWLERNADSPNAPLRGALSFILTGNPCRRVGGVVTSGTFWSKHGYLGRRKPTPETQYDVDDIARIGDVWANVDGWPSMVPPKVSFWQRILNQDPHSNYQHVDLAECTLREQSGNTKYWVSP
jgi:pimeloyl-ACP methyl ester carboxylesterase